MELFSAKEDYGMSARVARSWKFVQGFPLPKFEMICTCSSKDIKVCAFTFGRKDEIHITQKDGEVCFCDMAFRCRSCNLDTYYTVAIPEEVFALRSYNGQAAMYHWEKALKIIEEADV